MYNAFYELRQEPFHVTPDPEFLFPSPSHKEALAAIIYGIEQRKGFVAITGEVGVGKTTILRSYLDFADRKDLKLVYIYNSDLSFDELVTTLLQELGVSERPPSTFLAVSRLHEALIEIYRNNQTVVLIVDEAQNMPVETLESLRMLSNLETVTEKLIQIMLIGQPEFDEMLQQHRLRQLRQRIAIHARIGALNLEDSIAYLEHRLSKVALGTKPVFTKNALRLIAEAAQGIPRNLNILSDNALITGFGYQARPVNAKIVREVLEDRRLGPAEAAPRPSRARWIGVGGAAAASAAAAAAIAVFFLLRADMPERADAPVAQSGSAPSAAGETSESLDRALVRFGSWVDGVLQSGSGSAETAGAGASPEQDGAAPRVAGAPPPTVPSPAKSEEREPRTAAVGPPPTPPAPPVPAPAAERPAPAPAPAPAVSPPARPPASAVPPAPPPSRTAQGAAAPPETARAPAPAPAPAPVTRVETARVEPPARPQPAAPETSAPAMAPPPIAEPARPSQRAALESTPAPAREASSRRRTQPIPLAAPEPASPRPAPRTAPQRTSPSIAAAPVSPPAAYSMAVPSVVVPSASGSGAASGAGAEFTGRPPAAAAVASAARSDQLVRTVRFGDSLWTMAEDVYGYVNPNVLRRVQDANPHIRNINLLAPGQDVVFPRVPEAPSDAGLALYGSLPPTGGN